MITIIHVMRRKGVQPTKRLCWQVGNRVRDLYLEENLELPEKRLAPKTYDRGSHTFAFYPDNWFDRISAVIDACETEREAQGSFFEQLGV